MVKIKIIMPSIFKKELDDSKAEKADSSVPENQTEINVLTTSLMKKKDDKLEKAAGVPQLPTKPRTELKLLKKMESQKIMKKSSTVKKVRKLRLDPEALRKKIASIKYSRDYSFLLSVHQPVIWKSPLVKYPTELPPKQLPVGNPQPTPLKIAKPSSNRLCRP